MSNRAFIFIGSMNAMPMVYAQELRKTHEVLYFVDSPRSNTLSRPECHYPDIHYPYPSWIVEWLIPTQALLPLFRRLFAFLILYKVNKRVKSSKKTFVLNGLFISLSPYLKSYGEVIALSHGSDLMQWGNLSNIDAFKRENKKTSFYKFFPGSFAGFLQDISVRRQWNGFLTADKVIYFPRGFGSENDRLISLLEKSGVKYFPRFDVSFNQLANANNEFKSDGEKFVVFSGVRFLFDVDKSKSQDPSKGNDLIIYSLAAFKRNCQNLQIHFIEKGPDVKKAKMLCSELGLESQVTWHAEMPFQKLIKLYEIADVCFDSVGESWIGAIGAHALWMGKPLIANVTRQLESGWFPADSPILNCSTEDQIVSSLIFLKDEKFRRVVSEKSKIFAIRQFSPRSLIDAAFLSK